MKTSRKVVLLSFAAIAVLGGFFFLKQQLAGSGIYLERYDDGQIIPLAGLRLNPNQLSDSDFDAKEDFRRLSKALNSFYLANGKYPDDPRQLIAFTLKWAEKDRVTEETLTSADIAKSDSGIYYHDLQTYDWRFRGKRADGGAHQPTKAGETSSVLVSTDAYYRRNRVVFRDGHYEDRPEGYILTLWSDGSVREVPRSDYVGVGKKWDMTMFFRNEAGVPKDAIDVEIPTEGRWPGPAKK